MATPNEQRSESVAVVGIGEAGIDHFAIVDRYPDPESQMDLAGLSLQGGGCVANALAALAVFRVRTRFIGKLADDDFGRFAVRGLEALQIDTSGLITESGQISPYRFIIIERGQPRHTVLRTRGSVSRLAPEELQLELLVGAQLLLVDGFHVEAQVRAAELARQTDTQIVLHARQTREGMGELVALSDVLIASERYASEIAPRGEIEDSLVELGRMGPKTVVVTLGEEGSIGIEGDKLVRQPPLAVQVTDTTGSGEVYVGAFCYGLLQSWPIERCMLTASVASGLSCRELGARAGLPLFDEVQKMV